jgi:SNF2 family DNA or RNA helicase
VVAPKSLVFNWLDEARRFASRLRVVDYTGLDRADRRDQIDGADLVVTTYATLCLDAAALAARRFDNAILDEAQAIKNPASQVAQASRLLRADHRLALTGTPVENSLGDLASIFEFLNPGVLGSVEVLRAMTSAAPDGGSARLAPLARGLRPFLLRRTKQQGLPELPARTEQVLKCTLEGKQRQLYDQLRRGYQSSLLARVSRDGMAASTMLVLEALLRVRQAACHPGLTRASSTSGGPPTAAPSSTRCSRRSPR